MNIGFSVSPEFILGNPSDAGEAALLEAMQSSSVRATTRLKQLGVSSIELRSHYSSDPSHTLKAAQVIWESGLTLSIHGRLDREVTDGTSISAVYPPLRGVVDNFPQYQNSLMVTVHAFAGKSGDRDDYRRRTVARLQEWAGMIERDGQPVYLALELNRSKGRIDPSTISGNVERMVREAGGDRVGICWDMGHYYANQLQGREPDLISEAFLNKVIHTHIHGVGIKGTHFPLTTPADLPLEEYLNMLRGYRGIYNLELNCGKFPAAKSPERWIAESVEWLKSFL
jgi:sugar phosphate isomerase/epimerase